MRMIEGVRKQLVNHIKEIGLSMVYQIPVDDGGTVGLLGAAMLASQYPNICKVSRNALTKLGMLLLNSLAECSY